jgi:hypothetical protein
VHWSARITATAREGRNTTTEKRNNDEASLSGHDLTAPDAPLHTMHDVALERAPPEISPAALRALARAHAAAALEALAEVMSDKKVTASTRVNAATEVLDRGLGKAMPAADDDPDRAQRLETIRRIIVRPANRDSGGVPPARGLACATRHARPQS